MRAIPAGWGSPTLMATTSRRPCSPAVVLMGKNTMTRNTLLLGDEKHPGCGLDKLRLSINGNIGFIFATNCQLDDICDTLSKFRLPAAPKAGQIAQCDFSMPAGPTGMDPSQTAFFQGQIELVSETPVLKSGEKVSSGGAVLMGKPGMKPFEYGMEAQQVFQDGSTFAAAVLDVNRSSSWTFPEPFWLVQST